MKGLQNYAREHFDMKKVKSIKVFLDAERDAQGFMVPKNREYVYRSSSSQYHRPASQVLSTGSLNGCEGRERIWKRKKLPLLLLPATG